ncbi:hypothetical protein MTO98_09600 [Mucilaginibacter sp. SMC90]|uniref:hypothetical protein n=1 Tax=Mucilaginibacter sp. SMC90 TaxID=2929803 RepID=UPI001FB3690A|nr:hypothetical protein [Mucilaginibacter sp. SMC90]UOE51332.1 hypothetical protein MTO98_09600 [Mucilaginibacter sp. SMC90]
MRKYTPGQRVVLTTGPAFCKSENYTIISSSPVYKKAPLLRRLQALFVPGKTPTQIINYLYRCKGAGGMYDFLQEDIRLDEAGATSGTGLSKAERVA